MGNVQSALDYGLCLLPNGGLSNVLRLSLHLNHSTIRLPFYVDVTPLSELFDIVAPNNYKKGEKRMDNMSIARRRKALKIKAAMKKNCPKRLRLELTRNVPVTNLTTLRCVRQCRPQ